MQTKGAGRIPPSPSAGLARRGCAVAGGMLRRPVPQLLPGEGWSPSPLSTQRTSDGTHKASCTLRITRGHPAPRCRQPPPSPWMQPRHLVRGGATATAPSPPCPHHLPLPRWPWGSAGTVAAGPAGDRGGGWPGTASIVRSQQGVFVQPSEQTRGALGSADPSTRAGSCLRSQAVAELGLVLEV